MCVPGGKQSTVSLIKAAGIDVLNQTADPNLPSSPISSCVDLLHVVWMAIHTCFMACHCVALCLLAFEPT